MKEIIRVVGAASEAEAHAAAQTLQDHHESICKLSLAIMQLAQAVKSMAQAPQTKG